MLLRAANGARSSCFDAARQPLLSIDRTYAPTSWVKPLYSTRDASTARPRRKAAYKPSPSLSQSSSSPSAPSLPSYNLNPPRSTLPPELETVERGPNQGQASYLFAIGKAYLRFYKTGLKAVWDNGKAANAVRQEKLRGQAPDAGAESGVITRGEWLLLRRSAADRRRIPLFALLFFVCGEFTPLVVVFASPLVPWTCRIPRQVALERKSRQERRRLSVFDTGRERLVAGGAEVNWDMNGLGREQLLHLGRALGLYGRTWDRLGGFPRPWLKTRLRAHFHWLALDDQLLRKGDGAAKLVDEELRVACEDRGIDILDADGKDRDVDQLRSALAEWLEKTPDKSTAEIVLVG